MKRPMAAGIPSPPILSFPPSSAVDAWDYAISEGIGPGEACRRLEAKGYEYWGGDPSTGAEWYVPKEGG